ncbi:MAG: peptidoglycan-binding protein [Mastigocoleus sp. MO_167.B18]|uniref:peptidoglycan-binding protein n=1 Tax=Mastigocoleus sp. MO_188.B34 TaxID=3036635 RepID=UPI002602676D|nr:peptidoglycan-binding protein [Mastigocoleus sp. MO_188.B34]MDJ0695465.1 peptidoglycan-binding protein [Mastigocoleus sp. MO_188.B34]MDJ0772468.1 peptidoglycan-binding protein [Mastigocoleus sp. MO_167.B18]
MLSIYRDGAINPFAFRSLYNENRDNKRMVDFDSESSDKVKILESAEFDTFRWFKNTSNSPWIRLVSLLVIVSLIGFAGTAQALVLRRGSRGSSVVVLQNRLIEDGYLDGNPTGYYGSRTEGAVRNYQRDNDLLVDGIAGSQTLEDMDLDLENVGGEEIPIGNGRVTASRLNLRRGPGTNYLRVTSIPRGTRVTLYERAQNGWYRIDGPDGGYVWVSGRYIERF